MVEVDVDEHIREFVIDCIDEDTIEIDEIVNEIYGDEINFNNADPTSGQRCWEEDEIQSQVEEVFKELKTSNERCPECMKVLCDEDYYTTSEMVTNDPYPIYQDIVESITCSHCGFKESY